ncbi:MAG: sugar transferase [Patescibacteria group bacterium]|nr:sugar transferase [Patescibacteria group bacterium]
MKKSELAFVAVKPPLDYLAIVAAALVSYLIRYLSAIQSIRPVVFDLPFKTFFSLTLIMAIIWVVIFAISGLYNISGPQKFFKELAKIFVACSAGLAAVLAVMVFSRYLFDSRFIILSAWFLSIIFISLIRLIINVIQKISYRAGIGVHRVAIIGDGDTVSALTDEFSARPTLGYKIISTFPFFDPTVETQLRQMVKDDKLDEIIQINPNFDRDKTISLINFVNEFHLDYRYTADLLGTQLTNITVNTIVGTPIVEVKKTRLDGWGRIAKRIFDIFGSMILIILTSPVMLLAVVLIKLDSKGPVLFKYKRIGQYGKPFTYFKLRSMFSNAHQLRYDSDFQMQNKNLREGTPMIKFKRDPRITRVGRVIRRFSIDELPELFISLIGQMSLVGPRPHEIEEVEKYQRHHKKVLTIKPGITGLSQVSGRSDLDFEDEVKLDTFYIENWSLAKDIQIILKTPLAIIKRRKTE